MDMRYWKANFSTAGPAVIPGMPPAAARALAASQALRPAASVSPLLAIACAQGPSIVVTIEVWRFDQVPPEQQPAPGKAKRYALLISLPQDEYATLTCGIGFASDAKLCDELREMGLPILDARIRVRSTGNGQTITVVAPSFAGGEAMSFGEQLIVLHGVTFDGDGATVHGSQVARFRQQLVAPEPLRPSRDIATRPYDLHTSRKRIRTLAAGQPLVRVRSTRFPDLRPLSGKIAGSDASCGDLTLTPVRGNSSIDIRKREDAFVPACFRFDDVDVLGFRLDLDEFGSDGDVLLEELIKPLNFHLASRRYALPDFRYRPATRTLVIELLRYGKMALDAEIGQLTREDYQSQHELLIRVLVGRVDDDTAQGRDPAVFVPAIFVDNPWSKALGREAQGFDKRLANFCSCEHVLQPDGFVRGDAKRKKRVPVTSIDKIRLAGRVGEGLGETLLELDCEPDDATGPDKFQDVDLRLALGDSVLAGGSWRQRDFNAAEFRRSFARRVMTDNTLGFRSVQVSPISSDRGFESTWLRGRFAVERVRVAFPAGVASLTFKKAPGAPVAWEKLRHLFVGTEGRIDLPTGDWYRLGMKMRLTIEDGAR